MLMLDLPLQVTPIKLKRKKERKNERKNESRQKENSHLNDSTYKVGTTVYMYCTVPQKPPHSLSQPTVLSNKKVGLT